MPLLYRYPEIVPFLDDTDDYETMRRRRASAT
ncbi:hypothetical protein X727_08360 [Mesorhizobium sp. L103C119B0]|nr:hypothetical protein X728_24600 [Mesorhizobium sp. L103C120A0]ESZ72451.1 hypothetical protein X727_08360 [Mesorhizobium sp. L103C119B0]